MVIVIFDSWIIFNVYIFLRVVFKLLRRFGYMSIIIKLCMYYTILQKFLTILQLNELLCLYIIYTSLVCFNKYAYKSVCLDF